MTPETPTTMRDLVLLAIKNSGPITAKGVAPIVGRSKETVHQCIQALRLAKLVHIAAYDENSRWSPALFAAGDGTDAVRRSSVETPEQRLERQRMWGRNSYHRAKAKRLNEAGISPAEEKRQAAKRRADACKKANIASVDKRKSERREDIERLRLRAVATSSIFRMGDSCAAG